MGDVVGITGGMGGDLSGPVLGGAPPQGLSGQVALEVGVMMDKIAFHVHSPESKVELPVIVSFTLAEAYQVIAAIETSISHLRKQQV
jgi:hypothetical protein